MVLADTEMPTGQVVVGVPGKIMEMSLKSTRRPGTGVSTCVKHRLLIATGV